MPLEIRPDGTATGFETVDQMVEYQRKMMERDIVLGRAKVRGATAAVTGPIPAEHRERGVKFLRVIAEAGGEIESGRLATSLGLAESKALSIYSRAAKELLSEKFQAKQIERILVKFRDRIRGTVWRLDVAKVKEAGLP